MLVGYARRVNEPIILRYFDVGGRAQALRFALADAGMRFEDRRLTLEEWAPLREDPDVGGPFRGLPTLTWGDALVVETLPIAAYLARRLGQNEGLDDAAIARRDAICSNAYLEHVVRVGELVWCDVIYSGSDPARSLERLLPRLMLKLEALDRAVPEDRFVGGERPVVADFFAREALEAMRRAAGPSRRDALDARVPRLAALGDRLLARDAVRETEGRRPASLTARPDEPAAIERMRAADWSVVGL